jgi:hypothetical protein
MLVGPLVCVCLVESFSVVHCGNQLAELHRSLAPATLTATCDWNALHF